MKNLVRALLVSCLWTVPSHAKVDVLFHPTDPTLEKIAAWIEQAQSTVDIAMYNMDTTQGSPIIRMLSTPSMQQRLKDDKLSVRFIFEGYGTAEENAKKASEIEALGLDVRFVKSGKHVHHKFAVIDGHIAASRVITGSANWSLSSYRSYDENILFFESEPAVTAAYGQEFQLLWDNSAEFGFGERHVKRVLPQVGSSNDITSFFNAPRHIQKDKGQDHNLTAQLLRLIDEARTEIVIATTRSRIDEVNSALKAAADRGVKIKMVLSQDDFRDLYKRADTLLGHKNLEVRIKFYNLKPSEYLTYQMHNKWMVVDRKTVLSGSFNWSNSSENSHIENLVELDGRAAQEVMADFLERFEMLWTRGRTELPSFQRQLEAKKRAGELPTCGFSPIALTYEEARGLLKLAPRCGAGS